MALNKKESDHSTDANIRILKVSRKRLKRAALKRGITLKEWVDKLSKTV